MDKTQSQQPSVAQYQVTLKKGDLEQAIKQRMALKIQNQMQYGVTMGAQEERAQKLAVNPVFDNPRPGPSQMVSNAQAQEIKRRNQERASTKVLFRLGQKGIQNLHDIPWRQMTSLLCVKTGPSGVFFATFKYISNTEEVGTALCIKSCPEPVNSVLSNEILTSLDLFKVPNMRLINHKDQEYREMQFAMDKISLGDEKLRMKVRANINRPFILLMEYIPGFDLRYMLEERSYLAFHPEATKLNAIYEMQGQTSEIQKLIGVRDQTKSATMAVLNDPNMSDFFKNRELIDRFGPRAMGYKNTIEGPCVILGKLIAADIIMNNPDRVPSIWNTSGNETNIMFQALLDYDTFTDEELSNPRFITNLVIQNLVAIDNKTYAVRTHDHIALNNFAEYLKRISKFLNDIFLDVQRLRSRATLSADQLANVGDKYSEKKLETIPLHNQEVIISEMLFPSVQTITDFLRFHTQNSDLFKQGRQHHNDLDEDVNGGKYSDHAEGSRFQGQQIQTGRVCIQIILGILLGFMKFSSVGLPIIDDAIKIVAQRNNNYDYKNTWATAVQNYEDNKGFYGETIRVSQDILAQNQDDLSWMLTYGVALNVIDPTLIID